ncbi:hypothetical protein BGZ94_008270 [Podila epigama]|nr:hypothetical protein BGZ94_008270 [Podila epigama]
MIHIKTSVRARESIIRNAAALEPVQDGNQYSYTIHTPTENKLEKAVTFQIFVTIPRQLDSLESFSIQGTNIELAIGNIGHTFIKNLTVINTKGDISIDNFYGESATIVNHGTGGICGQYSVARLFANTKTGRIQCKIHLLNTDDQLPAPKVICSAHNGRMDLQVDGSDLFGPFTVEGKTQCSPLDVKILLANKDQRVLGNFINFGGPARVRLSGNFQGRIEARTHYGKVHLDEPEFVKIEGGALTVPSISDRAYSGVGHHHQQHQQHQEYPYQIATALSPTHKSSFSYNTTFQSTIASHTTSASTGSASWESEWQGHSIPTSPSSYDITYHRHPQSHSHPHPHASKLPSPPGSWHDSSSNHSKAESITGSLTESHSIGGDNNSALDQPHSLSKSHQHHHQSESIKKKKQHEKHRTEKQNKKDEEKGSVVTREVIGTIGQGAGLVMVKNSSGDITIELI